MAPPSAPDASHSLQTVFPSVPITALTATATPAVAQDIVETLGIAHTAQKFKVRMRQGAGVGVHD